MEKIKTEEDFNYCAFKYIKYGLGKLCSYIFVLRVPV